MANDSDSSSDESLGGFSSAGDDPFSFQQRKFIGKTKLTRKPIPSSSGDESDSTTSSFSSSPPTGRRRGTKKAAAKGKAKRKGTNDVDKKIEMLSKKRSNGIKKRHRATIDLGLSSSESSSSDEEKENKTMSSARMAINGVRGNGSKSIPSYIDLSSDSSGDENSKPQGIENNSSSATTTRRMTRTAARAAAAAVTLDSGSPSKRNKSDLGDANKDTVDALNEARQAMEALKEAQKYQAEDVSFELNAADDSGVICVDDDSASNSSVQEVSSEVAMGLGTNTASASGIQTSVSEAPTGVPMRLNVRIAMSTGQRTDSDVKKVLCKVRSGERLQRLEEQLSHAIPTFIPGSSRVKFSFDGQNLNLEKSPAFYEMEDEDLLDAIIDASTLRGTMSGHAKSKNLPTLGGSSTCDSRVKIRTRIKGGDQCRVHDFLMRKSDPLQKLIGAYGKQHRESGVLQSTDLVHLEYNGMVLNPSSTPQNEGIVDNTMLEINDEVERHYQLQHVSRAKSPSQIVLKCRINGDDKKTQTYGILPTDRFDVLINEFCTRNAVNNNDCKFEFDGEQLRTNQTPLQLDLEGGEIIEAIVSDCALATVRMASLGRNSGVPRSGTAPVSILPSAQSASSTSSLNSSTPSNHSSSLRSASLRPTSSDTNRSVISIQIMRNNDSTKLKKFKLYSVDKLDKLKDGYKKYYKKKGCRSVAFFFRGAKLSDKNATLESLGLREMDIVVAMENGRKLT